MNANGHFDLKSSHSQVKKAYQIDGKTVYLIPSARLFTIRTEPACHPFELLSKCLPAEACSADHIVDEYPEANVWVYRIPKELNISLKQLKENLRGLNDSRLDFVGSVWRDENSQRYQLYTGNLFLKFDPSLNIASCQQKIEKWRLRLKRQLGFSSNTFFVEPVDMSGFDAFDWAIELHSKPQVLMCQPELVVNRRSVMKEEGSNKAMFGHEIPSEFEHDREWIHQRVELEAAWAKTKGKGVKVCVIDDGIAADHPAFNQPGRIVAARDMFNDASNSAEHQHHTEIHGTACASVAASADYKAYGIAPECDLIIVRSKGLGSVLEAEAISWAVEQGADIISCSWGPSDGDIDDPHDDFPSLPLPSHTKLALEYAAKEGRNGKGCLVVFAAGNGREPVALDSYAANSNVIAVGAVNRQDRLSRYSDRGAPLFCVFPSSELEQTSQGYRTAYGVTVADRIGADGYSSGDYFSKFGGTSAAAPGVAGVAALALQLAPDLTLTQLKQVLATACEKVGDSSQYRDNGQSHEFGFGLLNARKAVQAALSLKNSDMDHVNSSQVNDTLINRPLSTAPNPTTESYKEPTMETMTNNSKPQGYALHIGVDKADPNVYPNFRPLNGCVNDAQALAAITQAQGFISTSLHNQQATRTRIKSQIQELTNLAKPGDLVFMSYAGHGSFVDDSSANAVGDERIDEVLVTYDGLLIDDEIYNVISGFQAGVRVIWVADCCHAESNLRALKVQSQSEGIASNSRELPMAMANQVINTRKDLYQHIQSDLNRNSRASIKAAVLGFYACEDDEQAQEANGRGAFTQRIEQVFERFVSDYDFEHMLATVIAPLSGNQHPKYELIGDNFDAFSEGVFRVAEAGVRLPASFSPVSSGGTSVALESDGADQQSYETHASETFIVVEKRGQQAIKLNTSLAHSDLRSIDTELNPSEHQTTSQEFRLIDKELQQTVPAGQPAWDTAYQLAMNAQDVSDFDFIEPDIISDIYQPAEIQSRGKGERSDQYLPSYPNPESSKYHGKVDKPFIWHLEARYSQLRPAFEQIKSGLPEQLTEQQISELPLICHIDTGVLPKHPTLPKFFDAEKSRSFTRFGNDKDATDIDKKIALVENQGHGHGTVSILAGDYVNLDQTGEQYKGYCGAFPYARVMTLKISEHVVLLSGGKFAKAIRHAIKEGANVVTMSMAGAPSRSMLKAINEAYEAGVVVVSAAGNSWVQGGKRILPKKTMYPARFNRVIGATGATLDKTPYLVADNQDWQTRDVGGANMQTCYGPESASKSNIAAYTPNVQWAGDFDGLHFNRSGGGTSSATPQVAAAAAMYMYVHRKELEKYEPAMRAEITRQALFQSAEKSDDARFNKVFGNGLLKAQDAIRLKPKDLSVNLKIQPRDSLGWFISDDIFKQLFNIGSRSGVGGGKKKQQPNSNRKELLEQMLRTELAQLCHLEPSLTDADQDTPVKELCARVQESKLASSFLKQQLRTVIPIKVPLAERRSSSANQTIAYSSHAIEGDAGQRLLINAKGCGFSMLKQDASDDDVLAEYEIQPVAINSRSHADAPSIELEMFDGGQQCAVLVIEKDMHSGEESLRWMMPKLSTNSGARSQRMANNTSMRIDMSAQVLQNSRGLIGAAKRFIVKLYRTAKDQALSDRKGLIAGRIIGGVVHWQTRDDDIDKLIAKQANTLLLVHGTFSAAETAFESLLNDSRFLNKLQKAGFGDYILAYNMSTIRSSVDDNASRLKGELTKLKIKDKDRENKIAAIGHSRGCLVARKALGSRSRMALVAGTHLGTPMASREHIGALINRVSNLAAITFGGTPALSLFLRGLSRIVQWVGSADGLEDQAPGSDLVNSLNKSHRLGKRQLLIASNFEPSSAVLRRLDDAALDIAIFGRQANDGVTPLNSALAAQHIGDGLVHTVQNTDLHHLNLLADDGVKDLIVEHFQT